LGSVLDAGRLIRGKSVTLAALELAHAPVRSSIQNRNACNRATDRTCHRSPHSRSQLSLTSHSLLPHDTDSTQLAITARLRLGYPGAADRATHAPLVSITRATAGLLRRTAGRHTPTCGRRRGNYHHPTHAPPVLPPVEMGSWPSSPALMGSGDPNSWSTSKNQRDLVRHGQGFQYEYIRCYIH
jgi:hypothetical protein